MSDISFVNLKKSRTIKLASIPLPGVLETKHENPCPHKDEMATLITFKETMEICKKCCFYTNDIFVCGH